ncbi:hypothetical protein D3C78_1335460 [compost metagenome]
MAGTARLAHRQIDGIANHINALLPINLQSLVIGGEPAFAVIDIAQPGVAHRFHCTDRRGSHQDVEGLFVTLRGIGNALFAIHFA